MTNMVYNWKAALNSEPGLDEVVVLMINTINNDNMKTSIVIARKTTKGTNIFWEVEEYNETGAYWRLLNNNERPISFVYPNEIPNEDLEQIRKLR